LVRSLFADSALSAAFVPVFTELLEHDKRKDALHLASALFGLILAVLGVITVIFIALAGVIMPIFTGPEFSPALDALTVGLSRVLFPIVILLGLNGLLVGVLNANDHFAIPAISPLVWNVVIIVAMVVLTPLFEGPDQLYAYAIGVVAGTACQFAMAFPVLRRLHIPIRVNFHWRDPRIKRILLLMLPVTIGLGLINFNLLMNSILGSRISDQAPAAIDKAFRIYMLPQGMFSVAVATVLFPSLARYAARRDIPGFRDTVSLGLRQIAFLLVPASVVSAALCTPIVRLLYERGQFTEHQTHVVAGALAAFSIGLTFNGTMLMLNRAFFSLQSNWVPTLVALGNLALNAVLDAAFYHLGIWGIPLATSVVNIAGTAALLLLLRRRIGTDLRSIGAPIVGIVAAAGPAGGAGFSRL